MRRWNGWGDDKNDYDFKLSASALRFVKKLIGDSTPLKDANFEEVVAKVPESRLPPHPMISADPEERLRHARGQSIPDWLAMRSGEFGVFPDGVAYPTTSDHVREILAFALAQKIQVIPYGGGTSVVGHINPEQSDVPVLTVSLEKMNKLIRFDRDSQLATFGAGTAGPEIEAQLKPLGYTLGHYPQSWELSTIGGWVASRSSGQQSLRYGRIENMFAGGRIETHKGTLEIPSIPASSAGPDIREMILGSEGRMGIISEVKARVTLLPEKESFYVVFFPNWLAGMEAVKELIRNKVQLSMMRLSNQTETFTQLRLAAKEPAISVLERFLKIRGVGEDKVMLTFGVTGSKAQCKSALALAQKMIRQHKGVNTGTALGKKWEHNRFRAPYLRHGLWDEGYLVDTMETAVDWVRVPKAVKAIESAIKEALAKEGESVHVFTHLSHIYAQGSSVYTTFLFRVGADYAETYQRWKKLKAAAANAILNVGGTISHQHGVGKDHAPYLSAEKGELGMAAIKQLCNLFDPQQQMNPGKLLP